MLLIERGFPGWWFGWVGVLLQGRWLFWIESDRYGIVVERFGLCFGYLWDLWLVRLVESMLSSVQGWWLMGCVFCMVWSAILEKCVSSRCLF